MNEFGSFEKVVGKRPLLFVTVGLPYSGKSTWAQKMASTTGADIVICSSDAIRAELGDENDQSNNHLVFETLHERAIEALKAGHNVIYDATCLRQRDRRRFLRRLETLGLECAKIAVVFGITDEQLEERMALRARRVPKEVIERMKHGYTVPSTVEGWDVVKFYDALRKE